MWVFSHRDSRILGRFWVFYTSVFRDLSCQSKTRFPFLHMFLFCLFRLSFSDSASKEYLLLWRISEAWPNWSEYGFNSISRSWVRSKILILTRWLQWCTDAVRQNQSNQPMKWTSQSSSMHTVTWFSAPQCGSDFNPWMMARQIVPRWCAYFLHKFSEITEAKSGADGITRIMRLTKDTE